MVYDYISRVYLIVESTYIGAEKLTVWKVLPKEVKAERNGRYVELLGEV